MSIEFIVNDDNKPSVTLTFGKGSIMMSPCKKTLEEQREYLLALSPMEEGKIGLMDVVNRDVPAFFEPEARLSNTDPNFPVQLVFESDEALGNLIEQLQTMNESWQGQPSHIDTPEV